MRGMRSCTLSGCMPGMVPRFPGCAARPWALVSDAFSVNMVGHHGRKRLHLCRTTRVRAGYSIYIYCITSGDAERVRERLGSLEVEDPQQTP